MHSAATRFRVLGFYRRSLGVWLHLSTKGCSGGEGVGRGGVGEGAGRARCGIRWRRRREVGAGWRWGFVWGLCRERVNGVVTRITFGRTLLARINGVSRICGDGAGACGGSESGRGEAENRWRTGDSGNVGKFWASPGTFPAGPCITSSKAAGARPAGRTPTTNRKDEES